MVNKLPTVDTGRVPSDIIHAMLSIPTLVGVGVAIAVVVILVLRTAGSV